MSEQSHPEISIVIPVYNEEGNLRDLHQQLCNVLDKMDKRCEIILVDDGSSDGSDRELKEIAETDHRIKVITFRRNFGQTAAMSAGFDYAEGEVVITLDADLQNDPEDIPRLLEKMSEGYDIVSGWRRDRKDKTLSRKVPSFLANRLISLTTGVHLRDYGCTLKAYKKEVVKGLNLYGGMHRFIPALASSIGVKVAELPCGHRPRTRGVSKYGIQRTITVTLDLITLKFLLSYSTKPLQIFGLLGMGSSGVGSLILLYLAFCKLILDESIGGRPLLLLGILLVFIGIQFITMGLLAELIVRTYHESQNKPIYVVKSVLGAPSL